MTTLTKIIVTIVLSLLLLSCEFDMNFGSGVRGNGNVVTHERITSESFNTIKVSHGLDLNLTQGDSESVTVEADENLHDLIVTEIESNTLKIYSERNIGAASSKTINVEFKDLTSITSTSGSDVFSTNTIRVESLDLNTNSGSDMELNVNANVIDCESSSGSSLRLSGKVTKLYADASSGSDIKAGNLTSQSSQVKASSGGSITVNTSKNLTAKASSGGDIKYLGNPEKVNKSDGVSGSIRKAEY